MDQLKILGEQSKILRFPSPRGAIEHFEQQPRIPSEFLDSEGYIVRLCPFFLFPFFFFEGEAESRLEAKSVYSGRVIL